MKIAVASRDGKYLSEHFGQSACFVLFTVADGQITGEETRMNDHGHHGSGGEHGGCHDHDRGDCHGHGREEHHSRHARHGHAGLLALLHDCEAVICGGMGPRAAHDLKKHGIRPVIAARKDLSVRDAVEAYLAGALDVSGATCSHHRH